MAQPATVPLPEESPPAAPRRGRREVPRLLTERFRPLVLAREELLPVAAPLAELLGTPGLRRGSTLSVAAAGGRGATSLALALLSRASSEGAWCAVVGAEELGIVAAAELGVALDRLVLAPRPGRRAPSAAAAFLDGCDIVVVASPLSPAECRKLAARARERRSILVSLLGSRAARSEAAGQLEGSEVRLQVTGRSFAGLGRGSGRLGAQEIDIVATRRSASPRQVFARLRIDTGRDGPGLEITLDTDQGLIEREVAR